MMTNEKPYILVVEDDAPVRNLITTTLESQNYKYMAAANGNQAVMSAASGSPDIIPVSYTHLDVYKRQVLISSSFTGSIFFIAGWLIQSFIV